MCDVTTFEEINVEYESTKSRKKLFTREDIRVCSLTSIIHVQARRSTHGVNW